MKKISYILFSLSILSAPLFSQGEVDALRFSREGIYGTARAMAMGGAFGALGGDLTGVTINPAGIAVYRSSEVVGTFNLSGETSKVGSLDATKTRFNMDNIGFVGYFPLRNDVMPLLNFGFSYNKLKSFDKRVSAQGNLSSGNTLMAYIARQSAGIDPTYMEIGEDLPDPFRSQPWLSVLGFNSYIINPVNGGASYDPLISGEPALNEIRTVEKGYVDNLDFSVGTTIANVLNLGISLTVKDIYYNLTSDYLEDFNYGNGYTLTNWMNVSGAGVGAKFGAIYRPVNSLRLGLAWHTPTWYSLSETYEAQIDDNLKNYVTDPAYTPGKTYSGRFSNDYDLRTPGKLVASVAAVLGGNFIASVDYELVNYGTMKLKVPYSSLDDPAWYDSHNEFIKEDHRAASTVKAGIEYRFTPQFSGRLGYAWMQNPYSSEGGLVKFGEPYIDNSNAIFRIEGDTRYFTGGFGYRFSRNLYADMAIVYQTQKDELYPFPNFYENGRRVVDATPFSLKNNSVRGLLTVGYKF